MTVPTEPSKNNIQSKDILNVPADLISMMYQLRWFIEFYMSAWASLAELEQQVNKSNCRAEQLWKCPHQARTYRQARRAKVPARKSGDSQINSEHPAMGR
jgi:hypothetical protein